MGERILLDNWPLQVNALVVRYELKIVCEVKDKAK